MFGLCGAGADGSGPPDGAAVQPHPEAHNRNQLPICGRHPGGHEHTTGHSAAAGAGISQYSDNNTDEGLLQSPQQLDLSAAAVSGSHC